MCSEPQQFTLGVFWFLTSQQEHHSKRAMILIKLVYVCNILRVGVGCRWAYFGAGVVGGDSAKGEKLWYVGQIGRCLDQYKKPTGKDQ